MTVAAAAVIRASHRVARVMVALAAVLTSLLREIRDSTSPVQTEAPARSCRVGAAQRRMGVWLMRTARLPCCQAWSCSFSRCWSVLCSSFIRWASVRCTMWLRRVSRVVV